LLKNEQNIASHKSCIIFAKLNSKVKSRCEFKIKLFQEHETINLYSILFQGEEDTEFEKFFNKFKSDPKYLKDLQRIIYWIEKISEKNQKAYNDNTRLNDCVTVLASLDFFIKRRQEQHKIEINDKTLTGNLSFYI